MKKFLSISIVLSLFLAFGNLAIAKNDKKFAPDSEVAVEDGTYDVRGHPELRVKVHVYKQDARGDQSRKPGSGGGLVLQCNIPDTDSASIVPSAGWHLPSSVTYRLNISSTPSAVKNSNLPTIAQRSYDAWSSAVGSAVQFNKGADTSVTRATYDLQNIVAWGRTSNSALAVTYTWYYPSTGLAVETDTIFNSNVPWAWADQSLNANCAYKNAYDAQDILTHELGHWMGLDDTYTSQFEDNTMFGYGSTAETKKDTLTTGDIAGVNAIYP